MAKVDAKSGPAPNAAAPQGTEALSSMAYLLGAAVVELHWRGARRPCLVRIDPMAARLLGIGSGAAEGDPLALLRHLLPQARRTVLSAFLRARRRGGRLRCRFTVVRPLAGAERRCELLAMRTVSDHWWCAVREMDTERCGAAPVDLLARVSHELRTPLNAVLGFTALLRQHAPGCDHDRYLVHIDNAARHLSTVVSDLTDFPRIQSGTLRLQLRPVPVAETVEEALAMVQPMAQQAGVALLSDGGDRSVCMTADRVRAVQVLLNLLTNAVKYGKGARGRAGDAVHVSWCTAVYDGMVRIAVRDNGAGLQPAQVAGLFEPFSRLGAEHTRVDGMGMGLYISRGLARLMYGDIEIDSRPGVGSEFALVLPLAKER